jgi:hypothetical protein
MVVFFIDHSNFYPDNLLVELNPDVASKSCVPAKYPGWRFLVGDCLAMNVSNKNFYFKTLRSSIDQCFFSSVSLHQQWCRQDAV